MASGDLVVHKYVAEVTLGVTPTTPALTKFNCVSSSLDAQINTTISNQISATGDEADVIQTDGATSGEVAVEWQYAAYDSFIESALRGSFSTTITVTGTDISAAATDNSLNSSGTNFSTSLSVGSWLVFTGFTGGNIANNGKPCKVVSVTTAKIVVSGLTLVDDAAGESITIKGSHYIRNGTTRKSFTIEKEFPDLTTTFIAHKGMVVNTMNMNATVGSIVTGSFGFNGLTTTNGTATVGTGAEIAATSNEVFSPVSSIGTIYENGTALTGTCIRSINFTTTSNTRNNQCLGNLYPSTINLGTLNVSGTLEAYFNSTTLLDKFLNATATSLAFWFDDAAGNHFVVDMPNVKFTTGAISGISKNSDAMVSLGFTALRDTTEGFTLQISEIPV